MPLTCDISITSYKISQSRDWLRCAWQFHVLGTFILLIMSAPTRFNWCAERIHKTWRALLEPGNWEPLLLDCPSTNYRQSTAGWPPPTNPLPLIVLRSSKQLRGDGDGVDECNSWSTVVQIEFLSQDNSLISLSDISSPPPSAPLWL